MPQLVIAGKAVPASKILCVARNYVDHAKEMGTAVPEEPIFFLKPTTSLLPGGGTILLPMESKRVEVETELAAILGAGGRRGRCDASGRRIRGVLRHHRAGLADEGAEGRLALDGLEGL